MLWRLSLKFYLLLNTGDSRVQRFLVMALEPIQGFWIENLADLWYGNGRVFWSRVHVLS